MNPYFSLFIGELLFNSNILYLVLLFVLSVETIPHLLYPVFLFFFVLVFVVDIMRIFLHTAVFFEIFVLVFAVRFLHTIDQTQKKIHSNLILLAGLTAAVIVWIYPAHAVWLRDIVILVLIVELIRLLVLMFRRKRQGV